MPSVDEFSNRIKKILEKYPYLVAQKNGKIVGYTYANSFKERVAYDWSVELSIYVDVNEKGQGIGQMLYNKLLEILRKQNIVNVLSCITYPNESIIIFHEKNNFKKVAHFKKVGYKFGAWHDVVWYENSILNYKDKPEKVKWINEIKEFI
ncbi:GNAT family N-acetyltransferase [Gemella sp. zg-1178]|uniref:GNAT family N-acetyltransferase n=1 Tax=Gemella sp. zg-1178 TaxID=2840372 RepID=UPI00207B8DC0|nr:GNAT family N-acetyltransferase [Gemella sp. zg-1178]